MYPFKSIMSSIDISKLLDEGALIDNKRKQGDKIVTLKEILRSLAKDSEGLKCAVGYFYLQGLALIINELQHMKEIKILMGSQTTKLTKTELMKTFKDSFDKIDDTKENISSIILFHKLVKESKTLKILAYFGKESEIERLHAKAYLFLQDIDSQNIFKKYIAGIVGSSNLTPSGLIGNTELNVLLRDAKDLQHLEKWFDELWKLGSDDFDKLTISEVIRNSIEKSKFGKHVKETFVYIDHEEFFPSLIKFLKADYLFEDWQESNLLGFQKVDSIRCLRLFREKNYRGIFLTSSAGLGKSYVACQVAKYFIQDNSKVLLIAPSGLVYNEEQWPRYLKEFKLQGKIDVLKMGDLQKDPLKFDQIDLRRYEKQYSLILVDEVHNFRNVDAYRTRNLKKIIDKNGDASILFLTATPINTSLYDLLNLIKLFHRTGQNVYFDKLIRELSNIVKIISETEYEKLTKKDKEKFALIQQEFEKEIFVKSTRETIKTSPEYVEELKIFTGRDVSKIPDPRVKEVQYTLDIKYKETIDGLIDFINSLTAAHLRIIDPEKGARLGPFFKWVLYKRFESDISSFYLTLKRIQKKNQTISKAIENQDVKILELEEVVEENEVEITFTKEYKEKLSGVIEKIKKGQGKIHQNILVDLKSDTEKITDQVNKLRFFLQEKNKIIFIDDRKLSALLEIIRKNPKQRFLIFTEYRDTLEAIKQFLENRFESNEIAFVDSSTKNKEKIIERFNDQTELRLLISTDALSEGYNISGADIVINFDIPYNPVRLIQRIGRATRLDAPKEILVINIRPAESIDKEIDLVERLKMRIEDIIRFVGLDYRIWFEREDELLKERRKIDIKIYNEVAREIIKGYKEDLWKGRFDKLETKIPYSNPTLVILQEAIKKFSITKKMVKDSKITYNSFTLLKGKKNLAVYHDNTKSFGEENLKNATLESRKQNRVFEIEFSSELKSFKKELEKEKEVETVLSFYNDKIDKMVRSILDRIIVEDYEQIFPAAKDLKKLLLNTKEQCGDQTGRIIRLLQKDIKLKPSENTFNQYNQKLEESFTRRTRQEKLIIEDKPYLAIGILE